MSRFFPRRWRVRVVAVLFVAAAVYGVMSVAGMQPRPLLLTALVGSAALLGWFALDLLVEVEGAYWQPGGRRSGSQRGADLRVGTIKRRLTDAFTENRFAAKLHPVLVQLIDDKLTAVHGINRQDQPQVAAEVLGPELTAFLSGSTVEAMRDPVYVELIIGRIETL